ncbi:MAG: DUF418 domain-containing protein [Pseudomonadota bacterium]
MTAIEPRSSEPNTGQTPSWEGQLSDSNRALGTREVLPDLVRAAALMGIAVVNSTVFAYPMEQGVYGEPSVGTVNYGAAYGMFWLAAGKFYALFSLMFGASLFYQIGAADRSDADFTRRQTRRLVGLGIIGLVHYILFFLGDILVTYALLGALLLTQIKSSDKALIRLGIGLILLQVLVLLGFSGLFAAMEAFKPGLVASKMGPSMDGAMEAFSSERFIDPAVFRISSYADLLPGVLLSQGIATFGYFCLGLAFARKGWISDPSAAIWARSRSVFLPLGLILGGIGAWLVTQAQSGFDGMAMLGLAVLFLAAPGQSLGYAGLLAALAKNPGPIVSFISKAGSASLTAYLLQSVIMATVFSGWGLGFYGQLPAAQVIGVGVATGLATILATALWMSVFKRGPVETVFRAWTYG